MGEGTVTLKNVTVRGSVTVKGGSANSSYFDNVRVDGTVRMEKEGVHLRLMDDTALGRVEIGLPCRITQDSTYKGALGALVIDLAKDSAREIQIEVPAKRVELLSRANVALNADVETLRIDRDAEGAQLDIKRGVTVGELSIDARVALTGSGLVVSLVVSVSGVTVSGTLTVEKTGTEGGAKAPTISGGSYTPVRIVTGAAAVADVTVDHGTSEADAMGRLPGTVTLNVTENGKAGTVEAAVSWALDKAYNENPRMDTVYTVTSTVTIPDGYYYNGQTTAMITTTVTVVESGETAQTKRVVDHRPIPHTYIGYASTETLVLAAARQKDLPTDVTLKCEDGSYLAVTVSANDWGFTFEGYDPNSSAAQGVSFKTDAALPMGYDNHDGKMTVYCSVEVKALEGALAAAKTQLDTLTDSEDAALADNAKILVAADGTTPDRVPKGVKFIERSQTAALKDAYAAAQSKQNSGSFTSQTECGQTAQELQEASDAFAAIVPNVGALYTNAMILEAVKNGGTVNPQYSSEFAYSAEMQPLRKDYTYWLYGTSGWTVPGSDVRVSIDWSVSGDGAQYLAFAPEGDHDHKNYMHSYGVTVTRQPDAPTEVRFVATVKDYYGNVIGTLGENGECTATIGAPMRLSDTQPSAPRFASGDFATGEIYINLNGVEAIQKVDDSKIGITGCVSTLENGLHQINNPAVTGGKPSTYGVCLDAIATH